MGYAIKHSTAKAIYCVYLSLIYLITKHKRKKKLPSHHIHFDLIVMKIDNLSNEAFQNNSLYTYFK